MAQVHKQKMTAEMDGDFVVFLIGVRVNKPWKIHKWLPVFLAMPRMLKELAAHPELGFLGHETFMGMVVQYWRSFEHLEAYARSTEHAHQPAAKKFYKRVGATSGDVGIWHETYLVGAGRYETVYGNMPTFGLGAAGRLVAVTDRRDSARDRIQNLRSTSPAK